METTLDTIQALGYHRASTNEIIKRAGVSRGAMLYHYPTKVALLTAAFQHLHDQIATDVAELIKTAENQQLGWPDLLDDIMERYFQGRLWDVFLEIMVAARTDQALWAELVPIVQTYYAEVDNVWHQHFTTDKVDAEVATLLNLSLCVIRGMALQTLLRDDPDYYVNIMQQWKALITPLIKTKVTPLTKNGVG